MKILLKPKYPFKVPVEARCITPNTFAGKSVREIASLKVWEGNREKDLGELFEVNSDSEVETEELTIHIVGEVNNVRGIGSEMSLGKIIIDGDVGMHLGEEMKRGMIITSGNADSWAGCMMKGGIIEIKGSTGDYLGASYRGSDRGMQGGTIIVHGNVGNETGCFMNGGLIEIYGDAGQFTGIHMRDGTIFIKGNAAGRMGAEMLDGKIIVCGFVPSVLPSFTIDSIRSNVKTDGERVTGPFYCFSGDLAEGGKGKIYISKPSNPHLYFYEKYL